MRRLCASVLVSVALVLTLGAAAPAVAQDVGALLRKGDELYERRADDWRQALAAARIWSDAEHRFPERVDLIDRSAHAWYYLLHYADDSSVRVRALKEGAERAARLAKVAPKEAAGSYWTGVFQFEQLSKSDSLKALAELNSIRGALETARAADEHYDFAGPDRFLGRLFLEPPVQDMSRAVEHLEKARELEPNYSPNLVALAQAYEAVGRAKDAIAAYQSVLGLKTAPGYGEILARDQQLARSRLEAVQP